MQCSNQSFLNSCGTLTLRKNCKCIRGSIFTELCIGESISHLTNFFFFSIILQIFSKHKKNFVSMVNANFFFIPDGK